MRQYKKWTPQERAKSLRLTTKAKKLGLIKPPTQCKICGQTEGILHYHNQNYDVTLNNVPKMLNGTATEEELQEIKDVLLPICYRCHMILHSEHRNKKAHDRYFEEVKNGKMYPPSFKPIYFRIMKEHGFYEK